jgi:putative flippase GtrA
MSLINRLYFRFRHFFSRRYPRIYYICDRHKAVIKFIVAGSTAGITDLVLLYFFHGLFRWSLIFSTSAAFIMAFLISFTLQKFWTFRNYRQDKVIGQLSVYMLNAVVGLYLNGFFMHTLVYRFAVWYILAQIIVNLALAVWNFLVYKFLVFRHK